MEEAECGGGGDLSVARTATTLRVAETFAEHWGRAVRESNRNLVTLNKKISKHFKRKWASDFSAPLLMNPCPRAQPIFEKQPLLYIGPSSAPLPASLPSFPHLAFFMIVQRSAADRGARWTGSWLSSRQGRALKPRGRGRVCTREHATGLPLFITPREDRHFSHVQSAFAVAPATSGQHRVAHFRERRAIRAGRGRRGARGGGRHVRT